MPVPISPNESIYIERKLMPASYSMPTMQASIDHYSLAYIISGDRKTFTPNGFYIYHSGNISMAPPLLYHRTTPISDTPYERILIKFREEMITPLIELIGRAAFDEFYNRRVYHFTSSMQDKIFTMCLEMLEEYESNTPYSELILQGMLQRLLLTIIRSHLILEDSAVILKSSCKQVVDALYYLDCHYKEDPSLEEVAAHVFLSPTYFSKLFKKQVGSTYSTYLNSLKLQHAQQLLIHSKLSIGIIAEEVGFVNSNYLCDVFKKHIGISPSKFRKLYVNASLLPSHSTKY
ncbi:MAG: helix-turn-helix transcriptional regulator [Cellulosilyticum sp.]|nr:helix-turn-helix transcriptional regulator [Cellulosilyticum sp.]